METYMLKVDNLLNHTLLAGENLHFLIRKRQAVSD